MDFVLSPAKRINFWRSRERRKSLLQNSNVLSMQGWCGCLRDMDHGKVRGKVGMMMMVYVDKMSSLEIYRYFLRLAQLSSEKENAP